MLEVQQEIQVPLVRKGTEEELVISDLKVLKDMQEHKEQQDHKVLEVQQEIQEIQGHKVLKVLLDLRDLRDPQEIQVPKDLRGQLELLGLKDFKVHLDLKVQVMWPEQQVLKVHKVMLDQLDHKVPKDLQVQKGLREM